MRSSHRSSKVEESPKASQRRTSLYWFIGGVILGILLAFTLFGIFSSGRNRRFFEAQKSGEVRTTAIAVDVFQAGSPPVGYLEPAARLWYRPDNRPEQQLQLLLQWENDGTYETLFLPVEGHFTERNAFAALKTRKSP